MTTAKVFKNGRSQAVRIPKAMEFSVDEVEMVRCGKGIYLYPVTVEDPWADVKALVKEPVDFPDELPSAPEQHRDLSW